MPLHKQTHGLIAGIGEYRRVEAAQPIFRRTPG
jgi:hypothetical protein